MSEHARCGAETSDGDQCGLPAGWGTDHVGQGCCKYHLGAAREKKGAPEGNDNAVTTGEHESIFFDQLEDEEQKLWHDVDTDALAQVKEQIRTHNIRIRRMLGRIRELKRESFTIVKKETKIKKETKKGHGPESPVDIEKQKLRATLGQIQDIEEALTRVQKELRRLIREKYRILKDQPADHSEKLDELLGRMAALRDGASDYHSPEMT